MYRSLLGRDCQLGVSKLLALLVMILLPAPGWTEKFGLSSPCCRGYEKNDINPKYFNRFKKSYQSSHICNSQREAVLFNLTNGTPVCANPEKAWAKLLIKRIDRVKKKPQLGKKGRPFEEQPGTRPSQGPSRLTEAPGTQQDTTPLAAVVELTTRSPGTSTEHQDSSKTPANTVQTEETGSPASEGQTTGRPMIAQGDANRVNPTWAPRTVVPTSKAAVRREVTQPLTTFPGEQDSSKTPANTVKTEGTGSPASEGQTTGRPMIAQGDANRVNPTWAPRTAVPTSKAAVRREVTQPLTTFPGEQEGGGSTEKAPEIPGSSPSPVMTESEGAIAVKPAPKPKNKTERAKQLGDGKGAKEGLGNSKVAVLILLPTVLILMSVIVYLRCKRGRQAPKYQAAPVESVDGVYDAL